MSETATLASESSAQSVRRQEQVQSCEGTTNKLASNDFLTFDKPIFGQFMEKKFSKDLYVQQINIPRRLDYQARFFESDFLEMLTKTYWWTPPAVWFPMAAGMFAYSQVQLFDKLYLFAQGLLLWSLLEYFFHRFVFHSEWLLPDNKYVLVVHFFTHAVHHFFPYDPLRLAMPPALFLILASITWVAFNQFMCAQRLLPLFAGIFVGFTLYDLLHYYFHHGAEKSNFRYIRAMRTYHAMHHFKYPEEGFGVSSTLWDHVFGTLINKRPKH